MLNIEITIDKSTGDLKLEENGNPNHGHSRPNKGMQVHWKVKDKSEIKYIHAIKRKPIVGSTDVFSSDPPSPQNSNRRHWKGKVNDDAEDNSVYIYSIEWVKEGDPTNLPPRVFDPIISVKPSVRFIEYILNNILGFVGLGISLVIYRQMKNMENKFNEINKK